jgi:hypothetical protein
MTLAALETQLFIQAASLHSKGGNQATFQSWVHACQNHAFSSLRSSSDAECCDVTEPSTVASAYICAVSSGGHGPLPPAHMKITPPIPWGDVWVAASVLIAQTLAVGGRTALLHAAQLVQSQLAVRTVSSTTAALTAMLAVLECQHQRIAAQFVRFVPSLPQAAASVLQGCLSDHGFSEPPASVKQPSHTRQVTNRLWQQCVLMQLALRCLISMAGQPAVVSDSTGCGPSCLHLAQACAAKVHNLAADRYADHGCKPAGEVLRQLAQVGASICRLICAVLRQRSPASHAAWSALAPAMRELLEAAQLLQEGKPAWSDSFHRHGCPSLASCIVRVCMLPACWHRPA